MVDALKNLVRDPRLILAIPSAFIGLLPMTAGAMMGAPIVDEAARRWKLTPAWKTFFNYWFRHIWEYSWPLYMNLILAAAIFRVPIKRICLVQFPFTVLAVGTGLFVLFRNVPLLPPESEPRRSLKDVVRVFWSIWPIFLTIILIFVFKLNMLLALAVGRRPDPGLRPDDPAGALGRSSARACRPKIVLLTATVMIFKRILEASGRSMPSSAPSRRTGRWPISCSSPRPSCRPPDRRQPGLCRPSPSRSSCRSSAQGKPDMVLLLFAYVSGFCGILLSPAHLCLALTADYFKAELRDVYKILVFPVAVIFAAALLFVALVSSSGVL